MADPSASHGAAEGTIKFVVEACRVTPPLDRAAFDEVEAFRARLWPRELIGHDAVRGYGYGNLSARRREGGFVITGTQTGHLPVLDGSDYTVVNGWDFSRNTVRCTGPCRPSSEALSHAAFYLRPEVGGVIHVHARGLWHALIRDGALSTEADIPYGSERLYRRIIERVVACTPPPPIPLLLVMKGHEDGVFAAGRNLAEAWGVIREAIEREGEGVA